MAKKKKQTIGYKYFASGHFVLCHGPIDAITKISFQDKDAYLNEESENKIIDIDKPSLFGGDEQSGGVQGGLELLFGHANQQKSSRLQIVCAKISDVFGGLVSAYRGVCSVVFDNLYIGTSPNMPDSKWRVKRIHTRHDGQVQWYDKKAEISPISKSSYYDSYYKFNFFDGFSSLSQLENYAAVNFDDSNWSTSQAPFGNNASDNTQITPKPGRALMIREWIDVASVELFGDLEVTVYHDDGGVLYLNGELISNFLSSGTSTVTISNDKFNEGRNLIFCAAVDSVPGGSPSYFGVSLSYKNVGFGSIDADINPAHIIRECLTNRVWGIGVAESNIDDLSFTKAADMLYDEKMGMSIKWTDSTSINEFVDNIKEHINAQLYLDRVTNKWKLYLIRDDYDVVDLISLDEGSIRNLDFERRTLAECVNSVTVTYWDRERSKDSTVTVQDIARIAQQGGVISQSIDYKGFTNSDLASRIALRELKTLSSTLASVSFDVDEQFSESWHEGMPFKLSDFSYGLSEAVMRIRTIKRGDGINNTVYVEAIEDSFSSPMQSVIEYVPPITSGDSTAKDAVAIVFEVPYIELVEQYGQDEVDAKLSNYPELGYVGMAAIRPNNQHVNASLYVDAGAGYDERTTLDFCPSAELKAEIGYMDSSFEIQNVAEFELLQTNNRIQINDEIMAFLSFDTTTNVITVKRGCFDTVPQKHVSGSKVFGWDNYSGIDDIEYLSGEVLSLKALTLTGSDVLDLNEATTHSLTLSSRAIRPYPPANVKINDVYWPTEIETDLVLTWVDRNRIQQTGGSILGWFDGGVAIEPGTQTHLTITQFDEDQVELATNNANVTGSTSYTFAISAIQADTRTVEIVLKTIRDGYECLNQFTHTVELSQFFSAPYDLTVEFKND